MGDAAHPTPQYFAQGACMALEDAVCLGETLASERGDIERGLELYRGTRLLRTTRIQLGSRLLGDHVYHADGPHAMLRNDHMQKMTVESFCEKLSWLYEAATSSTSPRKAA
ncbi:hypothetical protein [Bradyrhizobium elkanii]|uniref:hypothetical protein n=1 Tax=Bradyrhizobium elkanii TaxID=29448 RepID=UPI001FCC6DBF|nr:hypothetical protein [Bradyrhizobium elkanii]WLA87177.1 hypothetical protein QNJ99_29355 [Bradyrhizobium elkanii]